MTPRALVRRLLALVRARRLESELDGEVSADYFDVFGVPAAFGRTFLIEDEEPGRNNVVVLNHVTWQARFGSDPTLLNRTIVFDGEPHQVVGILPPGSFERGGASFWKPIVFAPDQRTRGYHWLGAVGG